MGCIPNKNKVVNTTTQRPRKQNFIGKDSKKIVGITRMDTCSTVATFSITARSKLSKRSSSIGQTSKLSFAKYISLLKNQSSIKDEKSGKKIIGPGLATNLYEILCQQQHIPFYLQMLYGFPYQNIQIFPINRNKNSQIKIDLSLKSQNEQYELQSSLFNFVLKDEVSIFLKFLIQCQKCYKLTTVTKSKSLIHLNFSNCQCDQQKINICLLKKQPQHIKIWLDDCQQFILDEELNQQTRTIKKNQQLRIIGCTSCWSFMNLKIRNKNRQHENTKQIKCTCSICMRCSQINMDCRICHTY